MWNSLKLYFSIILVDEWIDYKIITDMKSCTSSEIMKPIEESKRINISIFLPVISPDEKRLNI